MKLTPEERKAVLDSIRHWIEDIQGPLERGVQLINRTFYLYWLIEKKKGLIRRYVQTVRKKVKCYSQDCPLCELYCRDGLESNCTKCPYFKRYIFNCDDETRGHWSKFLQDPTLSTCNAMIDALEGILD